MHDNSAKLEVPACLVLRQNEHISKDLSVIKINDSENHNRSIVDEKFDEFYSKLSDILEGKHFIQNDKPLNWQFHNLSFLCDCRL
jgi:methionine-rich copper-binding protein CopC